MTRHAPFDWTNLAALAVVLAMLAFVLNGCDQPPQVDTPAPVSVTAPIGQALSDVEAIPPLALDIRDDAKALTPDNVPTLAPRIERNADEVIDHARAASAKLSETQAISLKNDRLVTELQGVVAKLQADNARLREAVERERASGIRKAQFYVGLLGAGLIAAGVIALVKGFWIVGAGMALAGTVAIGITTFWYTLADIGIGVGVIALVAGVGFLVYKFGWADDTIRRMVQAIEMTSKQAFATVKDVKANIATATDDKLHAIVRNETRPAGK